MTYTRVWTCERCGDVHRYELMGGGLARCGAYMGLVPAEWLIPEDEDHADEGSYCQRCLTIDELVEMEEWGEITPDELEAARRGVA